MENEENENIIILNDENGNEVRFEFLDLVELEDEEYVVLLPVAEEGEAEDGEVVILKLEDTEDDSEEESYVGIEDEEILSAINYHTTGKCEMSLLEKIIYIADYIEPMRYKASRLPEIRKIAFQDLDECMYEILKDTLEYLEEDSAEDIEPTSREAYIYYKELHNKRNVQKGAL